MDCSEFTYRNFLAYWMLTWGQVAVCIAIWELEKWLWRLARGRSHLTEDPEKIKLDRK